MILAALTLAATSLLPTPVDQAQSARGARSRDSLAAAPQVATFYFYWYRWPKMHFPNGEPDSHGHFHHFKEPKKVDYRSPTWHDDQFDQMTSCGIDIALPVYWGAPGIYDHPSQRFARDGLKVMVKVLAQREKKKAKPLKLGLFYDTTTLLNDIRFAKPKGGKPDLTKAAGKELFCRTVVEYFEVVPKRFWARVDGRALTVLYTSEFASAWNESLGPALRAAFQKRFGEDVFLVSDATWGEIGQDRTTSWGTAIDGPYLSPGIAQLGPGFDDSPVPGRTSPMRPREQGNFYRWSWRRAIQSKPELVLIETWNEMHEGCEICETKETGTLYLDITKRYVQRLHKGDPGPEIALRQVEPVQRPDRNWGKEGTRRKNVFVDYTKPAPQRVGLREVMTAGGEFQIKDGHLRSAGPARENRYLYFQVSDYFSFDVNGKFEVIVEAAKIGGAALELQYDSNLPKATERGAYADAIGRSSGSTGKIRRMVFTLRRARFNNRQNGQADFRLRILDPRIAIRRVEVRRKSRH